MVAAGWLAAGTCARSLSFGLEAARFDPPGYEFAILLSDEPFTHAPGDYETITRMEAKSPVTATTQLASGAVSGVMTTRMGFGFEGQWPIRPPDDRQKVSTLKLVDQSFDPSQNRTTIKLGVAAGVGYGLRGHHRRKRQLDGVIL